MLITFFFFLLLLGNLLFNLGFWTKLWAVYSNLNPWPMGSITMMVVFVVSTRRVVDLRVRCQHDKAEVNYYSSIIIINHESTYIFFLFLFLP